MRLFVALQPPPAALAELEAAVAPLRSQWPRLRWAGQDRWHVTLAFLGEVGEDRLGELATRLERAAGRHGRLTARIGRGGAFPSPGRARVLCAHVEGDEPVRAALAAIAASVAAAARRAGAAAKDEGRAYRPHVTLARCREPTDLSTLIAELTDRKGPAWTAARIHLIRSYLGASPRYETIRSWPLRAPG